MGTGAFTSVSAERTVDISVASDANAFLSLQPTGDRAYTDGDSQIAFSFDNSENGSKGLNPDARTAFTDLFTIKNQGANDVFIAVGLNESSVYEDPNNVSNSGHLFDNSGISGFVYKEENGSGPGLSAGGSGAGSIQIDSGGRVDLDINDGQLDSDGNVASGTIADDRTLGPGEELEVDLSIITGDDPSLSASNNKITVLAAEPGSDRADGGNGT
jgi:hypothetical protein